MAGVFGKRKKTFRPKKKWEKGTLKYDLHKKARASLHSGVDLRSAVRLPPEETFNDWVAIHVVDFFNRINLIYGTVADHCTDATCPIMSGGPKYEYLWADTKKYKKPTALSAPQYMNTLMEWIESIINNEDIFVVQADRDQKITSIDVLPSKKQALCVPFPKTFIPVCKKIVTRLYRVFVHIYIHHFNKLVSLGVEAHVNTCYKHFYFFAVEFKLIESQEFEPLQHLTARLCH